MYYKDDREWADKLNPLIKKIIKENLGNKLKKTIEIRDATEKEDKEEATDMVITADGKDFRMAVRTRRTYESRDFGDITIRSSRTSGAITELKKIKEGKVSYYFYCWGKNGIENLEWLIVDIKKMNYWALFLERKEIPNKDDATFFISVPILDIKHYGCVVASNLLN